MFSLFKTNLETVATVQQLERFGSAFSINIIKNTVYTVKQQMFSLFTKKFLSIEQILETVATSSNFLVRLFH